jgi:hypothetical protein
MFTRPSSLGRASFAILEPRFLLIVEPSSKDASLWRFGREGNSTKTYDLLTQDPKTGAIELVQPEEDVSVSDFVTAACLVRRSSKRERIEYDLSWKPVESVPQQARLFVQPERHRSTLGERAEARRQQRS